MDDIDDIRAVLTPRCSAVDLRSGGVGRCGQPGLGAKAANGNEQGPRWRARRRPSRSRPGHVLTAALLARGIAFAINKLWKAGPTQWGRAQHQQNRPLGSVRSPPLAESPGGHSDGLPPAALLARARSATIAHGARSTTSTVRAAVACTRCCSKEATAGWLSAMAPARAAGLRCSVVAACFVAAIEAP